MNRILKLIVALLATVFLVMGLRWAIAPAGVASQFGMPLLDGVGRSTQIGDLGAFFFAGGLFVLIGLLTQRRSWFYAAAMLVGFTALFRIVAWLFHGATLASDMIIGELLIAGLLLLAAAGTTEKR
ncbi:MAG: hypothetical protein ACI87W_002074 [Halieaceae bacterium]|jgi:hypothetical protein